MPRIARAAKRAKWPSLLFCAAALALLLRSFWVRDAVAYSWSDPDDKSIGGFTLAAARARLFVDWHRTDAEDPHGIVVLPRWSGWSYERSDPTPPESPEEWEERRQQPGARGGRWLGVGWFRQHRTFSWSPALPAAPVPTTAESTQSKPGMPPSGRRGRKVAVQVWSEASVTVPLAYLVLLAGAMPAWGLIRRLRRRPSASPVSVPPADAGDGLTKGAA